MSKQYSPVKSAVYLSVLAAVLAFSLYNLFAENAKSWFVSNKEIFVNPLYGRVLTSGAGRNLTSFKNNDPSNLNLIIVDESGDETATIRMVPGDVVHFVFLVSLPDPSFFDNSDFILNGIYGDNSLRGDCMIYPDSIQVSSVTVTVDETVVPNIFSYEHSETWQSIPNGGVDSLASEDNEIAIPAGVCGVTGTVAQVGTYAGTYLFLVDVPALYIDTGENQNSQKCEYDIMPDGGWLPAEGGTAGILIIERCLIVRG